MGLPRIPHSAMNKPVQPTGVSNFFSTNVVLFKNYSNFVIGKKYLLFESTNSNGILTADIFGDELGSLQHFLNGDWKEFFMIESDYKSYLRDKKINELLAKARQKVINKI